MPTLHDPVAARLFGLSIRWYAIFILLGIVVSLAIIVQLAKRRGLDEQFIIDVAPWVVLAAILGARLYYILLKPGYYADHPDQIINVRLGGLTIHGALAAGIATFWLLCRRRKQPFLVWSDVVIAAIPIGQAIGRWGNWANQEAFGTPTDLPWAVQIDPDRRPAGYESYATFHPAFLYEAVLSLAVGAILIWLVMTMPEHEWLLPGDIFALYLILYGLIRLPIERIRTDSLSIGPWPAAYWLSAGLITLGSLTLFIRHRRAGRSEATVSVNVP